jgi:hypothetical protein
MAGQNGSISAASRAGGGTSFVVRLARPHDALGAAS